MLPDPLHPAIVHLPIALALLMPMLALVVALAIRRGALPRYSWAGIVALQLLLVGSGWLAIETGEDQEERVERVVREHYIEEHEERAEAFVWGSAATAVVLSVGLAASPAATVARAVGVAATVGVLGLGIRVGHSGGELVYEHGAAAVYAKAAPTRAARASSHDSD
jgi:uncharacterized membrane protein